MNTKIKGLVGAIVGVGAVAAAGFGAMYLTGPTSGDEIVQRWHDQTIGKVFKEVTHEMKNQPLKAQSVISADVKIAEAMGLGMVADVTLDLDAKQDLSGEVGKMKADLSGSVTVQAGEETEKLDFVATIMGMDDTMYAQLTEMGGEMAEVTQGQVDQMIMPYVGEWFMAKNDMFKAIMSNPTAQNEKFIAEAGKVVDAVNVWSTSNFEKSGSEYSFDMEMDKEKVRALGLAVMDFQIAMLDVDMMTPQETKDMMKADYEEEKKSIVEDEMTDFVSPIKGRITLEKGSDDFSFEGVMQSADVDYSYDEEKEEFVADMKGIIETMTVKIENKEDMMTLVVADIETKEEMVACEYKEEAFNCEQGGVEIFSGTVSDDMISVESPMLGTSGSIEKTGKGEFKMTATDGYMTINVDRFFVSKGMKNFELEMEFLQDGETMMSANITAETKKLSEAIVIEVPEDATDMSEMYEGMMNGGTPMMMTPEMDMADAEYADEASAAAMEMYMDEMTEEDRAVMMEMMEQMETEGMMVQ